MTLSLRQSTRSHQAGALLFAGIPCVGARIILVSRNEVERHLKEAIERLPFSTHKVKLIAAVKGMKV